MKLRIHPFATVLFFVIGVSTKSQAQTMISNNAVHANNGKTAIAITDNLSENSATENHAFSAILLANYPQATAMQWHQNKDNSFVSFLNNGRKANACFSAKGKLNYTITACSMEQLPKYFSKYIRKNYENYSLFRATEIKAYGETAYQAILENATGFITLKYTLNEVEEIQKVKK